MGTPGYVTCDGAAIERHLRIRGLSVEEVAKLTRMDTHTIYRMIKGERVQLVSLQKLSKLLRGIDPDPNLEKLIA